MTVKDRYENVQSLFGVAHASACLFLCMLSIAEENNGGKPIDFISAYQLALANNCMEANFYIKDQEKLLLLLTGHKWHKSIATKLPDPVPNNVNTVERWVDAKGNTHFRRRGFDTLSNGVGTKGKKFDCYYIYTMEV